MAKKRIFKRKTTNDLVAVDLSDNQVRLVHMTAEGEEYRVKNIRQQRFEEDADHEMSSYLSHCFQELKLSKRSAVCIVPSKYFISKNVDMPSNDPEEISKIVDLQAGRYTPYSRDEIVIDYMCMENPGQHYTNVLLFIVNRKMIDRYIKVFERARVYLEKITIASEGSAFIYDGWKEMVTGLEPVGGVHMDAESSDLVIVYRGQMAFVRSIPIGAKQFKEDRYAAQETFINELNKSLTAFQDQGVSESMTELVVTGSVEGLDFLPKAIRENATGSQGEFGVRIVPYQEKFNMDERARSMTEMPEQISYFDMIATLRNLASVAIDMVPKEIKLKRQFREGGKDTITLGILIMACLVMICSFLGSKIYIKGDLTAQLNDIQQTTAEEARILERASTKARVLRTLIQHRGKGIYIFDKVTSLIGNNIYLTNFAYDTEGNLKLTGTADSMSGVFAFVTKLEESGYFSSVVTNETKTRRESNKDVADFDIDCLLIEEI